MARYSPVVPLLCVFIHTPISLSFPHSHPFAFASQLLVFAHRFPHRVPFAVRTSLTPSSVLLDPSPFRLLTRSLLFTRNYSRLTHDHTQSLPRSLHQVSCSFYPTRSRFSQARYLALITFNRLHRLITSVDFHFLVFSPDSGLSRSCQVLVCNSPCTAPCRYVCTPKGVHSDS